MVPGSQGPGKIFKQSGIICQGNQFSECKPNHCLGGCAKLYSFAAEPHLLSHRALLTCIVIYLSLWGGGQYPSPPSAISRHKKNDDLCLGILLLNFPLLSVTGQPSQVFVCWAFFACDHVRQRASPALSTIISINIKIVYSAI